MHERCEYQTSPVYSQSMKQNDEPLKHFAKHIGKYDLGDANLSVNYKQAFAEILDKKFPLNPIQQTVAVKSAMKPRK